MRILLLLAALALVVPAQAQDAFTANDRDLPTAPYVERGGIVITQNNSLVVEGGGVACADQNTGNTTENQYLRVFPLADEGLAGSIDVTSVDIGIAPVELKAVGTVDTEVIIHRMAGGVNFATSFPRSSLTEVARQTYTVTNGDVAAVYPVIFSDPVVFSATDTLVVEWSTPDGTADGEPNFNLRYGDNESGDTNPTYIATDVSCGGIPPTDIETLGSFITNWVVVVNATLATATEDGPEGARVAIGASQPNPTAGSARIPFSLEAAGDVTLTVHDALGREVAVLAQGFYGPGTHDVTLDAQALPTGTYMVRLLAEGAAVTRTLSVVR